MTQAAGPGAVGPIGVTPVRVEHVRGGFSEALLTTLGRPRLWALALAAFLVRGGILVMILPIVILPTPSGLTNAFGPAVTGLALGGAGTDLIVLIVAVVGGAVFALIAGALLGAWLEATLIDDVARTDDVVDSWAADARALDPRASGTRGRIVRGAAVHLLAHAPLVAVLAWGIPGVVAAGYAELILPQEMVTPLVLRIAGRVPETVGLIVGTWLAAEVVGGLAARELALGRAVPRALFAGLGQIVRRPASAVATFFVTQVVVLALLVPGLLGSGTAWDRVRILLSDGIVTTADGLGLALSLFVFVALWLGAFVLTGLATALRAVAWTTWALPRTAKAPRDSGWPHSSESGSL